MQTSPPIVFAQPSAGTAALAISGLVKHYGAIAALDGVSFSIAPGEILCVCGPNGAGKTTLLEIVQGSRQMDSGTVSVLDGPADAARRRGKVGVLFQDGGAPDKCRAGEMLDVFRSLYASSMGVSEALEAVGMEGSERRFFRELSGGQRRRVLVAAAMIGRPPVLLLDEPTSGLDPQSRERVWSAITAAAGGGAAILVTTHYLDEAEDYCDRVLLLSRGTVLAEGPARAVLEQRGLSAAVVLPAAVEDEIRAIGSFAAATDSRRGGGRFVAYFDNDEALEGFVSDARAALGGAIDLQVRRSRLEDLLLLAGNEGVSNAHLDEGA